MAKSGVLVTPPRRGVNLFSADEHGAPSPSASASVELAGPLAAAVEKLYGRHVLNIYEHPHLSQRQTRLTLCYKNCRYTPYSALAFAHEIWLWYKARAG